MYIYLGSDVSIKAEDIIAIFDIDNSSISKITRNYLANAEKTGKIVNLTEDIPKSFIVAGKNGEKVYLSQLAPATLKKRATPPRRGKRIPEQFHK